MQDRYKITYNMLYVKRETLDSDVFFRPCKPIHRKCEYEFMTAWSLSNSYGTIQFRQDGNLKQWQK